ncbi:MAG: hypothetical protein K1Y36_23135 [Blastocatellia bacterium]|nr:hypothetical protein [Blastocatellia bacterium]
MVALVCFLLSLWPQHFSTAQTDPELTNEDKAVFQAVLADFAKSKIEGSMVRGTKENWILVHHKSENRTFWLTDAQLNADLGSQYRIPPEIRENLRSRNLQSVSVPVLETKQIHVFDRNSFKPSETKPDFAGEDGIRQKYPQAKAWIWVYLPGYSRFRREAVVRFQFSPSPHGSSAIYSLQKKGQKWEIVWKKISHYV